MPILIDGHNLIGQMRDLALSDPDDEQKLVERLKRYATRANKRITVIFDPGRHTLPNLWTSTSQNQGVRIVFARSGEKADDLIRARVSEERDKQGLQLVTSDAAVANFARACGIRHVTSSGDFIRAMELALRPASGPEKPLPYKEYENWSDVFREPPPPPSALPPPPPPKPKLSKSEKLKQQLTRTRPLPSSQPESRPYESDGELKTNRKGKA